MEKEHYIPQEIIKNIIFENIKKDKPQINRNIVDPLLARQEGKILSPESATSIDARLEASKAEAQRLRTQLDEAQSRARVAETKVANLTRDLAKEREYTRAAQERAARAEQELKRVRAQAGTTASSSERRGRVNVQEHYAALGLDPRALQGLSEEQVQLVLKSNLRTWARVHHPDFGGSTAAMQKVTAAYDYLKSPLNRR